MYIVEDIKKPNFKNMPKIFILTCKKNFFNLYDNFLTQHPRLYSVENNIEF